MTAVGRDNGGQAVKSAEPRRPATGHLQPGPPGVIFLGGFLAIWGTLFAFGAPTTTGIELGPVALVATIAVSALIERRASGAPVGKLLGTLGLGRPTARSMVAGVVTAAAVGAVLPLYAWLAGIELDLRDNWFWLALALVAYHGVAEEVAWRGYAFGHLRRHMSFWRAVAWTVPLLLLTHLPVIVESGTTVGTAAMAVAAITCIPLAHLYEIGRRTIWAAALVHSAIDSFKLLEDPGAEPRLTIGITCAAVVVPLAALAWARGQPDPGGGTNTTEKTDESGEQP